MATYHLYCSVQKFLADIETPVSMYLRLRDRFANSLLLESTDYKPNSKCFSYICCEPIAEFRVENEEIYECYPQKKSRRKITDRKEVSLSLKNFIRSFEIDIASQYSLLSNGFFGYTAFDAVRYFEDINLSPDSERKIPDILYHLYRYVIAVDHYKNEMFILNNRFSQEEEADILSIFRQEISHSYSFQREGEIQSNFTDLEFRDCIEKCKKHVFRGDVFQIVPSRRFSQCFSGDEFNVYRLLRSINPSPYLFYFDYGNFKIFGSSPEAQLVVQDQKTSLFPIAGTYRRTGNEAVDIKAVEELQKDPKEASEHVMLVDLARNDLSKHCREVCVENYKEIQFYSHVIHLTSRVSGRILKADAIDLLHDTFPMGTLSGAPKYRAMELIDQYEKGRRRSYGGSIGCFGFDGSCNHAIVIRSFLSLENTLHFQAGAGIVADSVPDKEVQEVNNKLAVLIKALERAEEI